MRTDILQQAQAIRASMDAAAIVLTDEQAAKAPRLYPTWVAGMAVKAGDRLYYPGTNRLYKVGSDHTTQSDWTPDAVPALYTVIDVAHAGRRMTPSRQSMAWNMSTACTTATARTGSCACASAPVRLRAVWLYCNICRMN